jgi:hypothetical protein
MLHGNNKRQCVGVVGADGTPGVDDIEQLDAGRQGHLQERRDHRQQASVTVPQVGLKPEVTSLVSDIPSFGAL